MNETQKPQTIQDYFNIAWQHAVVEKQPPSVSWGEVYVVKQCLYRTIDRKELLFNWAGHLGL